jgi:hypothetical protein
MKDAGVFWPLSARHVIGEDGKPIKDAIQLTEALPAGAIIVGHGAALALTAEQFNAMQKKRALKRNQPELDEEAAAAAEEARKTKVAKKLASKVFETAPYMDADNRQLVLQAIQVAAAPKPAPVAAPKPATVAAPMEEDNKAEDSVVEDSVVPPAYCPVSCGLSEEVRREEVTARNLERAQNEHWDELLKVQPESSSEEEEQVETAIDACTAAAVAEAIFGPESDDESKEASSEDDSE